MVFKITGLRCTFGNKVDTVAFLTRTPRGTQVAFDGFQIDHAGLVKSGRKLARRAAILERLPSTD